MAITMNAFETVAVITAMPTVAVDLHGDSLYGAAFSAYMLASLVALIWSGESADRHGPFLPFLVGVASFALGLVLAGLAPSMGVLVLGRILRAPVPARWRASRTSRSDASGGQGRAESRAVAAWVLPPLAPLLAGFITAPRLALGLPRPAPAAADSAPLAGPRSPFGPRRDRQRGPRHHRALLLAVAVGVAPPASWGFLPVAVVPSTLGGTAGDRSGLRPLPGAPSGPWGLAAGSPPVLREVAFFGTDTFLPLAASRLHGAGPLAAGAVVVGSSLTWTAGSWLSAKRSAAWQPWRAVAIGSIIVGVGIVSAAPIVVPATPLWLTFLGWSLAGPGIGIVFNLAAVTASMTPAGQEAWSATNSRWPMPVFIIISGIGGALIAVADHTTLTLSGALVVQFSLAAAGGRRRPGRRSRPGRGPRVTLSAAASGAR
jgi:MFS family permease